MKHIHAARIVGCPSLWVLNVAVASSVCNFVTLVFVLIDPMWGKFHLASFAAYF